MALSSFTYVSVGPEYFNKLLAEAFQYTYVDLTKNREGELGRGQLRRLIWDVVTPFLRSAIGCAVIIGSYFFLSKVISDTLLAMLIQFAVLVAIGAGIAKSTVATALFFADMFRGKVVMVEGRLEPSWNIDGRKAVNHDETGSRTVTKYRFVVSGESFDVPDAAFRVITDNFEAGLPIVRLYHTPRTRKILSIESVGVEELQLKPQTMKRIKKPTSIWKGNLEA